MELKTIEIKVQIHASQKYCNDEPFVWTGGCPYLDEDGALYCTLFQKGLAFENGNSKNRIKKCNQCKGICNYDKRK